jgi:hypothetical protein
MASLQLAIQAGSAFGLAACRSALLLVAVAVALAHRFMVFRAAATTVAGLLAASVRPVDRGPGAPFGFMPKQ